MQYVLRDNLPVTSPEESLVTFIVGFLAEQVSVLVIFRKHARIFYDSSVQSENSANIFRKSALLRTSLPRVFSGKKTYFCKTPIAMNGGLFD